MAKKEKKAKLDEIRIICDQIDRIYNLIEAIDQRQSKFENWTIKKLAESERKRQWYESIKETWQCGNCNAEMPATKQFQHVCC